MDFKKKLENFLSSNSKKTKIIMVLGVVGIFLIVMAGFMPSKKNSNKKNTQNNITVFQNTEEYVKQLESKIDFMVSQIEGVGNSKVTITMENGVENIYANSEKKLSNSNENLSGTPSQRNDIQRDVVVIDGAEGKQALIVTQKEPTVKGVVVVCEGADNSSVAKRVTDAVSKALHIKSNRLSVVKGNPLKN